MFTSVLVKAILLFLNSGYFDHYFMLHWKDCLLKHPEFVAQDSDVLFNS